MHPAPKKSTARPQPKSIKTGKAAPPSPQMSIQKGRLEEPWLDGPFLSSLTICRRESNTRKTDHPKQPFKPEKIPKMNGPLRNFRLKVPPFFMTLENKLFQLGKGAATAICLPVLIEKIFYFCGRQNGRSANQGFQIDDTLVDPAPLKTHPFQVNHPHRGIFLQIDQKMLGVKAVVGKTLAMHNGGGQRNVAQIPATQDAAQTIPTGQHMAEGLVIFDRQSDQHGLMINGSYTATAVDFLALVVIDHLQGWQVMVPALENIDEFPIEGGSGG